MTSLNGPSKFTSASANAPRYGEATGRGEEINYGDDEDEIDSMSPSASHSSLPSAAKKIRRTHARRSCLACRKRKARCELPDITVPSSMDPLPYTVKCHRCKTLDTDCIVWDGDRKMKGDRPARYGPPQDKIAASKGRSTSRTNASAGRSPLTEHADGSGDSDAARRKRKAASLVANSNRHTAPLQFSMREPHLQDGYEQAVPNLRTIAPVPATEQPRTRHWAATTEDMIDTIGPWSDADENSGARQATNDSSSRPTSKSSSVSGPHAANHTTSDERLLSKAVTLASSQHRLSSEKAKGGRSDATSSSVKSKAEASGLKMNARDYRMKLMNATGRNAALMSEIIYGAPEYRARAREGETVAYAYRGVPVVDEGTVPRDKVEALIRAHPFLNPELVNSVPEDADPASGRVFLSNVVNYLCLKPNPPPDLTSFVIRHSSIHVIMQSRNRETCQALLLLVLYEPSDLQLGKPAHDVDVQLDHCPGHHLYQAAMNCALSLGLDRVIPNLSTGPDALDPNSPLQQRMSKLRDAALWLTVSGMGVSQAFSSTRPQLPPLFPSMADIDAFQDAIQPLLSASTKDNAALASVYHNRDTRQKSEASSASDTPHPPLTYQALAMSLHILSRRARTSLQVRTYWNELNPYDFCDAKNIMSFGRILVTMTIDVLETQLRNKSELEELQALISKASVSRPATSSGASDQNSKDPILNILLKWAEIEALETIAGLNTRVLFFVIMTLALKQHRLSKLAAYEGFDTLQPEQADMIAEVAEWTSWVNERLLRLASSLLPLPPTGSDPRRAKQAEKLESSPALADYQHSSRYLHLIPHFQFSAVVFVAAKQSVEHKLFVAFGSGDLGSGNKTMLAVFGRAVQGLVTLAQGDRLSVPAIVGNVLREFARRYANIVKKTEEVAARDKNRDGSSKKGSSKNAGLPNAGGFHRKGGDTASSRFAVRCANAVERVRMVFGDPAHWPPGRKLSGNGEIPLASEKTEAARKGGHPGDVDVKLNSKLFEDGRSVANISTSQQQQQQQQQPQPQQQQQAALPLPFDASWDQQQQQTQQQQYPRYDLQMSMQTDDFQPSPPILEGSGSIADYDSRFPTFSETYLYDDIGGGTAGSQNGIVPPFFSLGDYTHAALDHLLGTLDNEFMGFPIDLQAQDATGDEGSIVESIVNQWDGSSFHSENGQDLLRGGAGGSAIPSGYAAHYPQAPSSAIYTHEPIAAGPGPSPAASSSYSSDLSSAAIANGLSISRMISSGTSQPLPSQPPQAHQHVLNSQPAPYAHQGPHGQASSQSQGRGPLSAGLYSPITPLQSAYLSMGAHQASASAPPESAPLISSYAYYGDARKGTQNAGVGPALSDGGINEEAKLGPSGGGHSLRPDNGGYYAASTGAGGGRANSYGMGYDSAGGGSGGADGIGGGFMQHQHQQQQQRQQQQQGYQHAASQQYQHQHHQQQQQARHR